MIWRREKQYVKDNHYLCETGTFSSSEDRDIVQKKCIEDTMGKDMIFRPDKYE